MRFACDTGGTFTDLVVEHDDGTWTMYKAATVPHDPAAGVLDALGQAAAAQSLDLRTFLAAGDTFIHGTTHAINAVITGIVARTALLTTRGHRDVLYLREGGRIEAFNHTVAYPKPYVPRALTFEVPERVCADGTVLQALDEPAVLAVIDELRRAKVEAVAVCLLWSVINSAHEQRVGALLREHLPGVPVSLSHELNPILREYRRASSTAIDASLKPLMARYLGGLTGRLKAEGFDGRVLMLTSQGGVLDAAEVATAPIRVINSGPSMAPSAGGFYASRHSRERDVIVADTGGTTYDVSLVRDGVVPFTRETWIGQPYRGHITGLPSVDVKSIGAGGGSLAWVDAGGVLHVGPKSAGAVPGPACYGRGGLGATVTDATVVLGYIDPEFFLGGRMKLDAAAARAAIERSVAGPMRLDVDQAAAAVLAIATENMVQAIEEITVNRGIDPSAAVLIGGGGAAGLNSVFIARRLGCPELVIPEAGAVLSAAGALMSELTTEVRATHFTTTNSLDLAAANAVLERLERRAQAFIDGPGRGAESSRIDFRVEARYRNQVWEIDVPLAAARFGSRADVAAFAESFHQEHERLFAIDDRASDIEIVGWVATARCRLRDVTAARLSDTSARRSVATRRSVYFDGTGRITVPVLTFAELEPGRQIQGPAIVENAFTTVVIDPRSWFNGTEDGTLVVHPRAGGAA